MLQWVRIRCRSASNAAPFRPIASVASRSSWCMRTASASATAATSAADSAGAATAAARTRARLAARFTAVGRTTASRCSTERIASRAWSASAIGASRSPTLMPYAPAMPIAGAPRTASVRIASATSSTVVSRRSTTSPGNWRWSTMTRPSSQRTPATLVEEGVAVATAALLFIRLVFDLVYRLRDAGRGRLALHPTSRHASLGFGEDQWMARTWSTSAATVPGARPRQEHRHMGIDWATACMAQESRVRNGGLSTHSPQ